MWISTGCRATVAGGLQDLAQSFQDVYLYSESGTTFNCSKKSKTSTQYYKRGMLTTCAMSITTGGNGIEERLAIRTKKSPKISEPTDSDHNRTRGHLTHGEDLFIRYASALRPSEMAIKHHTNGIDVHTIELAVLAGRQRRPSAHIKEQLGMYERRQ